MDKYWKVHKNSYKKLNTIFSHDFSDWNTGVFIYKSFYLILEKDDEDRLVFSWMPIYHSKRPKADVTEHSDKPKKGCYDSLKYFKKYDYEYMGEIGARKKKLKRLNYLSKLNEI